MALDMSGVQAGGGFEAKPNGWYLVAVTDYEERESGENAKNPGATYTNWELTIQEGPYEGQKFWTNTSHLPQALFALKGLIGAAMPEFDDWTNVDLEEDIYPEIQGRSFWVKNSTRMYDGEKRDNIKSFKPEDDRPKSGIVGEDDAGSSSGLMP